MRRLGVAVAQKVEEREVEVRISEVPATSHAPNKYRGLPNTSPKEMVRKKPGSRPKTQAAGLNVHAVERSVIPAVEGLFAVEEYLHRRLELLPDPTSTGHHYCTALPHCRAERQGSGPRGRVAAEERSALPPPKPTVMKRSFASLILKLSRCGSEHSPRSYAFFRSARPQHGRQQLLLVNQREHQSSAARAVRDCTCKVTMGFGHKGGTRPLTALVPMRLPTLTAPSGAMSIAGEPNCGCLQHSTVLFVPVPNAPKGTQDPKLLTTS